MQSARSKEQLQGMIKGRGEGKSSALAPSADLLVCFPSRPHLTLMPKPICSPARSSDHPNKLRHHHQRKRSISRGGGGGGGQTASPLLWTKTKSMDSEITEPTSPKVTCAGQIKVRPTTKTTACRSWQSVMEEIEKIHNDKKKQKKKKRLNWVESLGFKKEIMQFLTCLRTIKFDLRCFGSFPGTDTTTEDEDEDEEDEEEQEEDDDEEEEVYHENNHASGVEKQESDTTDNEASRTVFSKWFMVLQEDQNNKEIHKEDTEDNGEVSVVPPPNALLLMRCRSAPAKSWLKESEGGGNNNDEKEENSEVKKGQSLRSLMEEEKLVVMRCHSDYYDIATETWIVGGLRDPVSRSRSWKR